MRYEDKLLIIEMKYIKNSIKICTPPINTQEYKLHTNIHTNDVIMYICNYHN